MHNFDLGYFGCGRKETNSLRAIQDTLEALEPGTQ